MKYRPEIDGLRVVAVVPVILFHMGSHWFAGGYIGVDVFFVISGYLIASIVIQDLEAGSFTFRGFWARRVRRIFPAMATVTAASLAFTSCLIFKGDRPAIGEQAVSSLLSVANIYFVKNLGNYWGPVAEESPFLHTWSLSVEEQFYLLFPIAVWLIFRLKRQWLRDALLFVAVSSLCLFLVGTFRYPTETFYLLPTRAWELATGCYLASALSLRDRDSNPPLPFASLAIAGLCLVLASYVFVRTLSSGLVMGVVGTALVIAFGQTGPCFKLLSLRPIVYVGKLSYSLYLWHWPVFVFADHLGLGDRKWMLLGPIGLLSFMTYVFVEQPTRRRGSIPVILGCYALILASAVALVRSNPNYDQSEFESTSFHGLYYDVRPKLDFTDTLWNVFSTVDTPRRTASGDEYLDGGIIVGRKKTSPQIVVLGDSHGTAWSHAIRAVVEKLEIDAAFCSMNGVSPFITLPISNAQYALGLTSAEKAQYDQSRLACISRWKPKLVIVCTSWASRSENDARDLMAFLEEHAGRVLLMEQPPELAIGDRNALQYLCYLGVRPENGARTYLPAGRAAECEEGRALVRTLCKRYRNCDYIPTFDLYSGNGQVLCLDGRTAVYVDDDHLSDYGSGLALDRIEEMVIKSLGANADAAAEEP